MPGLLSMYVGPLGGGKTTRAAWKVAHVKQEWPWVPIISNVPIEGAIYVPDVVRFLKVKFIIEGKKPGSQRIYMLIILDEANSSGFEARGSGFSPGDTMLIQFARKLKVDIDFISQLLSMIDKRGQWLASFYVLCKAVMEDDKPVTFEYKIYNEALEYQKTEYLQGDFCEKYIFPTFDTYDIPNYDALSLQLIRESKAPGFPGGPINSSDMDDYERILKQYATKRSVIGQRERWLGSRWSSFWDNVDVNGRMPVFEPRPMPEFRPKPVQSSSSRANELLKG